MSNKDEDIAYRAGEAAMLMGHPLLTAALDGCRETMVQAIIDNPLDRDDLRDKYMLYLKVLEDVKDDIRLHVENGKIANRYREEER